jgi:tRNA threonylcarbamoyladenosine biosynthesis protein TsaE
LRRGDVLALCGDLGAGKTHFVKGLAAALAPAAAVTSPTFTLIHEYLGGRLPLYHFDFYRLEDEDEALKIGLDEYLDGDGVCVIEWADKFPHLLPAQTRWYRFTHRADGARVIEHPAA